MYFIQVPDAPLTVNTVREEQAGRQRNGTTGHPETQLPDPQTTNNQVPGYSMSVDSRQQQHPSIQSPLPRPGTSLLPYARNDNSIIIPEEHEKIVHLACSHCGNAIEMTDNLIQGLITSGSKLFEDLMMKKIRKYMDIREKEKKSKTVKTEVNGDQRSGSK